MPFVFAAQKMSGAIRLTHFTSGVGQGKLIRCFQRITNFPILSAEVFVGLAGQPVLGKRGDKVRRQRLQRFRKLPPGQPETRQRAREGGRVDGGLGGGGSDTHAPNGWIVSIRRP